jgi:hypothetical protein
VLLYKYCTKVLRDRIKDAGSGVRINITQAFPGMSPAQVSNWKKGKNGISTLRQVQIIHACTDLPYNFLIDKIFNGFTTEDMDFINGHS